MSHMLTRSVRDLMSAHQRYVQLGISVAAWSVVLVVVTYWLQAPKMVGQPTWESIVLLGLLVGIAVMAEDIANYIVSSGGKKSSTTRVVRER